MVANSIPAQMVEYTWVDPQDNNEMRTPEAYAIANGTEYIISYGERLQASVINIF
jgi:hypothetical protein